MNFSLLFGTFSWILSSIPSSIHFSILNGPASQFSAAFRTFAQAAAPLAVAALWQGAAVAAGLALGLRLAPRISAAHRFLAWAAACAVLVGLQLDPVFAYLTQGAASGTASASAAPSVRAWFPLDARWGLGLAALWIAFSLLRAADLALHSLRLRKLWKSATPIEDRLFSLFATPPHRRPVLVCTTPELDRPSVIGFFAPRILIPDWLYARLTAEELEQVILHEAEHLRRRDDWTNLLQKLCLVLFPLNPALWWIERRLCREREMACDEGVVRVTRAPRAYAACLASLAERRIQRRAELLSLGAFERRPELVHRVHSILLRKSVLSPLGARSLLGALGCGLLFGSVELARCPQMVAFVPAQPAAAALAAESAQVQAELPQPLPASDLPVLRPALLRGTSAFRATSVEAILPSNSHHPAPVVTLGQRAVESPAISRVLRGNSAEIASAALRQQLLKAEIPSSPASSAQKPQPEPQEWVVLTAWQVQTSAPGAEETADYGAGANAAAGETGSDRSAKSAGRIVVTRLILTVYPANPSSGFAQNREKRPAPRPNPGSIPILSRPATLPFDSGWLLFQL
ncbi:MAG: M56 family metallopeptidase [Terracidiphilus sp.]